MGVTAGRPMPYVFYDAYSLDAEANMEEMRRIYKGYDNGNRDLMGNFRFPKPDCEGCGAPKTVHQCEYCGRLK